MLNLSKEKLDNSVGALRKAFNDEVLEACTQLATTLKTEAENGGNELVKQALDNCLKVQNAYNPCVESMKGFLKDMTEVSEIAEYLEKQASIGDVASHDTSFSNQGISADEVRM